MISPTWLCPPSLHRSSTLLRPRFPRLAPTLGRWIGDSAQPALDPAAWKPRMRSRWTPLTVILVCVPAVSFGLGTWQVRRRRWKQTLVEDLEHKMRLEPMALPRRINAGVIPEFEHRRVRLQGKFDHSKEILIESRTRDAEPGFHVVTPFYPLHEDSRPVLINRGFIRRSLRQAALRPASQTDALVELVAMIRKEEPRSWFQPPNDKHANQWYSINIQEISDHLRTEPVLLDAITLAHSGQINEMLSNGIPVGRSPQVSLRNMHAAYIATWYGLSAITGFMAYRLLRKPLSGRSVFAGMQ